MWLGWPLAAMLMLTAAAQGREEPREPQFKYAAGTENLVQGCEGNLELGLTDMTFRCVGTSVTVPYSSITLMQYRNDVSKKVRKLKLKWKVAPSYVVPFWGAKRNRFFTVVFKEDGKLHAMVLRVAPQAMRPYLAEIDLKACTRVEVQSYEDY